MDKSIGIFAPQVFPIRDDLNYGGAELFIYYFCEQLGKLDIKYTLYAPVGSKAPGGELVETIEAPSQWGTDEEKRAFLKIEDDLVRHDIINDHSHTGICFSGVGKQLHVVKTLHGVSTWKYLPRNSPRFMLLSEYHKKITKERLNVNGWIAGLGVKSEDYPFNDKPEDYYLHLGLLAPHKGQNHSINLAKKLGLKLLIAGEEKFVPDPNYVEDVKKHCTGDILYLGSVDAKKKMTLISNAKAVFLPFLFNEAYAIILFESLMCGTPVITTPVGAIPEMLTDKVGFIGEIDRFPDFVKRIGEINRQDCRDFAIKNYDIAVPTQKYLKAFDATRSGQLW
jgi:glycosyltransferase involved in cell wall biosynthesis